MTCGHVSPLSTQSIFEDILVDFEGTTAGDPVHTGIAGSETAEICGCAVLERQGIITRRA